jgi:outer membrane receptor protein involved in Fe transport
VQPQYSVQLGIDNLLDATHYEPVMFFGGGYFDQTQPRSFSLKLTYEW